MSGHRLLFEGATAWPNEQQWGFFMRKLILSYLRDESGAAAAEYALILTIIGTTLLVAVGTLGNDIGTALNNAGTAVSAYKY
jgi:pilus assembly protein Flp/PilA